jgi:hypothetical protein
MQIIEIILPNGRICWNVENRRMTGKRKIPIRAGGGRLLF